MAATSVQLTATNAYKVETDDSVTVSLADNTTRPFETEAAFRTWVADRNDPIQLEEVVLAILCGHLLGQDPDLDSEEVWNNAKMTLNAAASDPADILKMIYVS